MSSASTPSTASSTSTSGEIPQSGNEFASRLPVPSNEAVQVFRELFHRRHGKELDETQALALATRFLQLFSMVASASSQEPSATQSTTQPVAED
jgi:hypothetical protein